MTREAFGRSVSTLLILTAVTTATLRAQQWPQFRGAQSGVGDVVAVGVRKARDEAVQSKPAEVIGDLSAGHRVG